MIKVKDIEEYGFSHGIEGMRFPLESWDRADSEWTELDDGNKVFKLGENDEALSRGLFRAGDEHAKHMRFSNLYMTITAPIYWWKEFDTYRIGVEKISTSTMHNIHKKPLSIRDFSIDGLEQEDMEMLSDWINHLNKLRVKFLNTKDKTYWDRLIKMLPTNYNQTRKVMISYQTALRMVMQRSGHKLQEWRDFVEVLKNNIPYYLEMVEGAF